MNAELTWAIRRLQNFPTGRAWFAPVELSKCETPDRDIDDGWTLPDIQWIEPYKDWNRGILGIPRSMKVDRDNAEALIIGS